MPISLVMVWRIILFQDATEVRARGERYSGVGSPRETSWGAKKLAKYYWLRAITTVRSGFQRTERSEPRALQWHKWGNSNFYNINCENQDSNSRPWTLKPCQVSCTSQRNQKSELMKRARQFTYTHQHPHSRVTNQGRRAAAARTGTGETEAGANWQWRSQEKSTRGHKGGQQQFL
jgi:hypothetical protein